MTLRTIGIVSPGDMGQAVAVCLKECGFEVLVALDGRSARTRALAAAAGLEDCGSIAALGARADLLMSIIDPGAALQTAREVASAMRGIADPAARPLFADCNALAPQTKQAMDATIRDAGGRFVDVAIIGPPPRGTGSVRLYASGPDAGRLEAIRHEKLAVRVMGTRVGDAAAVKMCYGAVTKGMIALGTELLIAAQRLGVAETLDAELQGSQRAIRDWLVGWLPSMPPKAYRWVPETREIAATFEAVGLPPETMRGAAALYEIIAATPLGGESPEQARAAQRDGDAVVSALSGAAAKGRAPDR